MRLLIDDFAVRGMDVVEAGQVVDAASLAGIASQADVGPDVLPLGIAPGDYVKAGDPALEANQALHEKSARALPRRTE